MSLLPQVSLEKPHTTNHIPSNSSIAPSTVRTTEELSVCGSPSTSNSNTVPPTSLKEVLSGENTAYSQATKRLLIFDYDGTLTPIVSDPSQALLSDSDRNTLNELSAYARNEVWIVSGRDKQFLTQNLSDLRNIGFFAEHGAFLRRPGLSEWETTVKISRFPWWLEAHRVFAGFCAAIPASWVEKKSAAIVWHYRANEDAGSIVAPAMQQLLQYTAKKNAWDVQITQGKCVVEARPDFINKGYAVRWLLDRAWHENGRNSDFVLCAGDDVTDEDMFQALADSALPQKCKYSTKVDADHAQNISTAARYHLREPRDLWDQMKRFSESDRVREQSSNVL